MMRFALLLLFGCHRADVAAPDKTGRLEDPIAKDRDEIIARVDDHTIFSSDVAAQAAAAGTSTKQALSDLIDAEVLAREAERRGLAADPEVLEARRREMVMRLLENRFEKDVVPSAIPMQMVRRAYQSKINQFDHSLWVDVWHILVPAGKNENAAQHAAAKTLAEHLLELAQKVRNADEFQRLATQVTPVGAPLKVEQLMTAKEGWLDHRFSFAAFDQLHKPGDVSQVVQTDWGYHVIYLNRFVPPVHISVDPGCRQDSPGLVPRLPPHGAAPLHRRSLAAASSERVPGTSQVSAFGQVLAGLMQTVRSARGAVFADWEGEAVDQSVEPPVTSDQIRLLGAHLGVLFTQADDAAQRCDMGRIDELEVLSHSRAILVRRVDDRTYAVLDANRPTPLYTALRTLRHACQLLLRELA